MVTLKKEEKKKEKHKCDCEVVLLHLWSKAHPHIWRKPAQRAFTALI